MILTKDQCKTFCQGGGGSVQFQYTCLGTLGHDEGANYCASVPPTSGPVGVDANRFNSLRACEQPCYSEMPNPDPAPGPGPDAPLNYKCVEDYGGGYCLSGSFPADSSAGVYSSVDRCLAECQ